MFGSLPIDIAALVAAMYVLGPIAVHWTFRFAGHCQPNRLRLDELPTPIERLFRSKMSEIQELGFEMLGSYDCGALASNTRSYVAYFCDRRNNDFANISAVLTPRGAAGYIEFSTRFSNGQWIETNTNRVLPLTPANPDVRVFRFPGIRDARTLLHTHRQLLEKYAPGLWAQGEPRGEEIQRLVRVIENYGPRHVRIGYMHPAEDGQSYKLTWKGAFLMTWRGLWPVSMIRKWTERYVMHSELHALRTRDLTALQKA